jgi:UDP-N-acetylglucosamine 2-epimerase
VLLTTVLGAFQIVFARYRRIEPQLRIPAGNHVHFDPKRRDEQAVQDIIRETENLLANPVAYAAMTNGSKVYGDGHAAETIIRVLEDKLGTTSRSSADVPVTAELSVLH